MAALSVEETVSFAAQFRLPASMPLEAKRKRVRQVLVELGLEAVAKVCCCNTRVRARARSPDERAARRTASARPRSAA